MNVFRGLRARGKWLVFLATAFTLCFAATASAATKPYSLVVCALGSSNETCAPSSPAGVPVSTSGVVMTATFTNKNKLGSGIQLGSVNLTPPSGFTVSLASSPLSGGGTATIDSSGIVELRGLNLATGSGPETLTMSVATPAQTSPPICTVAVPCPWSSVAKQSNDFSGSPGNNLTVDPGTSTLGTVLAHLQFGAQPHNAILGDSITDTDYTPPPTGRPVKVDATDSNGTIVASYVGKVTVGLVDPITGFPGESFGTLSGDTFESASGGVATFSSLQVSAAGIGYGLTASTPDLPPAAGSTTFDVQQAAAICGPPKKSCTTDATSPNFAAGDDQEINVTVTASGSALATLTETVDFGFWPKTERDSFCGDHSDHFTFSGLTTAPGDVLSTSITTIDQQLTKSNFNASVKAQEICLAQAKGFTALIPGSNPPALEQAQPIKNPDGTPGTLPDGMTPGFEGLEPDCGTKSGQVPLPGPCVTGRTGKLNPSGGGTLTITDSSPFDRYIN